ncbi:MAG: sigma-70 family RNA polymerase sigma factor [Gemmataceae bacterium]
MPALFDKTMFRLRRLVSRHALGDMTDRQLLDRFASHGDEEAFAALVRRHAGLVLGVCRRVLPESHDAEDAFQATFLVLARKASRVAWQACVKNWLHGVAYRVSLKARRQALRRRQQERAAAAEGGPVLKDAQENWDDLRRVLDEELAALPARYRAPLILCYLEGRTRDEAAEELGWSAGSVKGRLERGRDLLRQRLLRRGLSLSAVLCAGLLPEGAAAASPALIGATVQAGLSFVGAAPAAVPSSITLLAQGVLNAMLVAKLKISAVVLCVAGLLGLGTHWLVQTGSAQDRGRPAERRIVPDRAPVDREAAADPGREERRDSKNIVQGAFVSFDAAKGLITLLVGAERGRDGVEKTYHLAAKEVPFLSNLGDKVRPMTLTKGAQVALALNELDDVAEVRVNYPTVAAVLSGVNAAEKTVSVGGEREPRSFKVAATAKLMVDGKPAKLEDFKGGMRVNVVFDFERSTVLAMASGEMGRGRDVDPRRPAPRDGDPRGGDPRGVRGRPELTGIVIGVNAKEGTLEVAGGSEDETWIKTLVVPKEMKIDSNVSRIGVELGLADIARATRVTFALADDKKTLARLSAHLPVVRVTLGEIDAAKGTVKSGAATYTIDKGSKLVIPGQEGSIGNLKAGMQAIVFLSPDRSRIVLLQVAAEPRRDAGRPTPERR